MKRKETPLNQIVPCLQGKSKINPPQNCDGYSCMYCINIRNEFAASFPVMKPVKAKK